MYNTKTVISKDEIIGEELEFLLQERESKKIDFLLVDVREEYEYQQKRISGVDNLIPMSQFFDKVSGIKSQKEKLIIVQCKLGGRSSQAQRQLKVMGFNRVINLAGGISEYKGKTQ
jgi:rhodanese-related sulfurtransferase